MFRDLITGIELRKFRADEEDVNAYVHGAVQKKDKQEILTWLNQLSHEELSIIVTPYLTEKMTEKLSEEELDGEL